MPTKSRDAATIDPPRRAGHGHAPTSRAGASSDPDYLTTWLDREAAYYRDLLRTIDHVRPSGRPDVQ